MASKSGLLVLQVIFVLFVFQHGSAFEFEVGGEVGWRVPPLKAQSFYNEWAQKNRFRVNDTLHFKYKEDSVMEVTKEAYNKCQATKPLFFDNDGDTNFTFDRPGLFFFISGVAGHCEKDLKMVVKVMDLSSIHTPPQQSGNDTSNHDGEEKKNGANEMVAFHSSSRVLPLVALAFLFVFLVL